MPHESKWGNRVHARNYSFLEPVLLWLRLEDAHSPPETPVPSSKISAMCGMVGMRQPSVVRGFHGEILLKAQFQVHCEV